jgi:pyrroline-5-carboxylate reductase
MSKVAMPPAHAEALGFIGCGQMGGALLAGWLRAGLADPRLTWVADPGAGPALAAQHGVQLGGIAEVLARCDRVVLAVKPQIVAEALRDVTFSARHLVLSVVAGLDHGTLSARCAPARVVRCMPNVACGVGAGVTLVLAGGTAPADLALAEHYFSAVGSVEPLAREAWFHAGTAVSGCGPAFAFVAMEAMTDAAVAEGLPRPLAARLAAQTWAGAGALALAEPGSPAILKDRVTSPAGATIEGVRALEREGMRAALWAAVAAATRRSQELAQPCD